METEQIALFISRLAEKSKTGSMTWSSQASNSYTTVLAGYKISISEIYDEDDDPQYAEPDYYLAIYKNGVANWIDRVTDSEMSEVLPGSFKIMQGIYRSARRNASGFGKAVDDLLKALDDDLL